MPFAPSSLLFLVLLVTSSDALILAIDFPAALYTFCWLCFVHVCVRVCCTHICWDNVCWFDKALVVTRKLVVTSASLLVTSALLVVTRKLVARLEASLTLVYFQPLRLCNYRLCRCSTKTTPIGNGNGWPRRKAALGWEKQELNKRICLGPFKYNMPFSILCSSNNAHDFSCTLAACFQGRLDKELAYWRVQLQSLPALQARGYWAIFTK